MYKDLRLKLKEAAWLRGYQTWRDFKKNNPSIAKEIQAEIESDSGYLWEKEAGYEL